MQDPGLALTVLQHMDRTGEAGILPAGTGYVQVSARMATPSRDRLVSAGCQDQLTRIALLPGMNRAVLICSLRDRHTRPGYENGPEIASKDYGGG